MHSAKSKRPARGLSTQYIYIAPLWDVHFLHYASLTAHSYTQNVYKAAKRNEYPCNMSRRVGRNLYETVCRQMQTN